jgi:hypothetical protein
LSEDLTDLFIVFDIEVKIRDESSRSRRDELSHIETETLNN